MEDMKGRGYKSTKEYKDKKQKMKENAKRGETNGREADEMKYHTEKRII